MDDDEFDYWTYEEQLERQYFAEAFIDEYRSKRPDTKTIVPMGRSGGLISLKWDVIIPGDRVSLENMDKFTWKHGDPYYRSADYG